MFFKNPENAQYDPQYETSVVLNSGEQLARSQGPRHVIQRVVVFWVCFFFLALSFWV